MAKEIFGVDSSVLREVKNLFKETNIEEIEMDEPEKFYIRISRKKTGTAAPVSASPVHTAAAPAPVAAAPAPAAAAAPAAPAPAAGQYDDEARYFKIKSPVIGTFYAAPSPDASPFVKVGDTVSPDTTVCIVEAMKVMNEIKAEVKGRIVQGLKNSGDSILNNETMFVVEKA